MKTILYKANVITARNMRLYTSAYVGGMYKLYFEAARDQILLVLQDHCIGGLVPMWLYEEVLESLERK